MSLDERVERGQSRWRLDLNVPVRRVLAQDPHELVDLTDGLARDLLDRLERRTRLVGAARRVEPAQAGVDEDHVDRVTGGIVEVAGDARAFLRGRQPALALGIPLRAQGALLELGHPLAPQPRAVARQPGAAPEQHAEHELGAGEAALVQPGRRHVDGEHEGNEAKGEQGAGT